MFKSAHYLQWVSETLFDDKYEDLDGRYLNLGSLDESSLQNLGQVPLDDGGADAGNGGGQTMTSQSTTMWMDTQILRNHLCYRLAHPY